MKDSKLDFCIEKIDQKLAEMIAIEYLHQYSELTACLTSEQRAALNNETPMTQPLFDAILRACVVMGDSLFYRDMITLFPHFAASCRPVPAEQRIVERNFRAVAEQIVNKTKIWPAN